MGSLSYFARRILVFRTVVSDFQIYTRSFHLRPFCLHPVEMYRVAVTLGLLSPHILRLTTDAYGRLEVYGRLPYMGQCWTHGDATSL